MKGRESEGTVRSRFVSSAVRGRIRDMIAFFIASGFWILWVTSLNPNPKRNPELNRLFLKNRGRSDNITDARIVILPLLGWHCPETLGLQTLIPLP